MNSFDVFHNNNNIARRARARARLSPPPPPSQRACWARRKAFPVGFVAGMTKSLKY